jgi:hypothetical protein
MLRIKLSRTAKALRTWSKALVPQSKLAMAVCRDAVGQLELAQESRSLSSQERELVKHLKGRILGLATIQKSRARQKSRLT